MPAREGAAVAGVLEAAREVALAGETGAPMVVGAAASPEERCGLR